MQRIIAFVMFFSLPTISLGLNVSVYSFLDFFTKELRPEVKPFAVLQHPWQFSYQLELYDQMFILIRHIRPSVTRYEVTYNRGQETIKAEKAEIGGQDSYAVSQYSGHSGVKIRIDLFRSEVLCSSLLVAEGRSVGPASAERTYKNICRAACVLNVDLTNECVDTESGNTTVKAVLENVTSSHDIIETTTIKVNSTHCKLEPHISVEYNCIISYGVGVRPCQEYEPPGTRVTPECKHNYFSYESTLYMTCDQNGDWNRIVTCEPECGRVTPISVKLIAGGNTAERGELPWYVAIYKKPTQPGQDHKLICGGSIVSTRVVISAGHCFWGTFGAQDASLFAVATAKLYRKWDHKKDRDVQKSNLLSVNFTDHYLGATTNQQDDIAILTLETPIKYYNYVRRVCLDFTPTFNDQQLQEGAIGKVAGFGLTAAEDRMGSPVLKTVSLPYVPIRRCQEVTPESFTENLTGDKICAGYTNGTAALCKGDSGGGLSFPSQDRGVTRYFLRGIVSTAPPPSSQFECNTETVITFTSIINHERFIKQFL